MASPQDFLCKRWCRLIAGLLLLATTGCGGVGKCYPVEGRVLVGDQPLTGMTGVVLLVPDQARGNSSRFKAAAPLDTDGRYKVSTQGKAGAPPGWYKVVITAVPPGTGDREADVPPTIPARYTSERTTPLTIAVVAARPAGGYVLRVSLE